MPAAPPLVLAPPEKLRLLAEARERLRAQEAEKLRNVDVFGLLGYAPTPKQQVFHNATEWDVLFGGSSGGGKSVALVGHAIRECIRYPGIRVGAFRRTYPELKESLLTELSTTFAYGMPLGCAWNGNEYELRFPNGSLIMFRYAESLKDATRRQGGQFQLLIFDERTLTPSEVVSFLESRLRSGRAEIPVLGIRSSANPGGAGHGAVKARYITATNYGEKVVTDERGRTVRFVPSSLSDNPHVNPEYASDLMALPDKLRAAFLDGNWDVFSGQMFPELSRERHVVRPFALPESWRRYNGIDWGFTNPYAVIWGCLDPDGRVWLYREINQAGVGEADQARQILAAETGDEHVSARYADDAVFAARGDAKPISSIWSENGLHVTAAGKGSRVTGWQRVRSYLAEAPACEHHRALGWETCPRLHMFSTLKDTYRTLADLGHNEGAGDPEDANSAGDDHLCLTAGTMVATAHGPVPIERVTTADSVWTRKGLRRVRAAGMTAREAATGSVLLSNGAVLRGTANHPVWVAGRGWERLDALRYSDILSTCPAANPSSSTGSHSGAIPIRNAGQIRCTSRLAALTASGVSAGSIRRSGKRSTGRSRRVTTSTTGTRTRSTTTLPTSSASPAGTTSPSTWQSATCTHPSNSRTSSGSGRSRWSGTAATRAANGTASTRGRHGLAAGRAPIPAKSAAASSRPGRNSMSGSARTTASRSGGACRVSTTRTACARPAAAHSGSTSTPPPGPAPVSVVRPFAADAQPRDVYNLTVEGEHEFYANGVLVHNCDALRYLLINLGGGAEAWLAWAKRKAAEAAAETAAAAEPLALPAPAPQPDGEDEERAEDEPVLPEPDPAAILRQARNAALRAGNGTWQ